MIAYEYCGRLTYHYPAKRVKYVSETGRTLCLVNLIYHSNRRHVELKNSQTSDVLYYWYPVLSKGPLMAGVIGEREGGRDVPMPLQKRPDDFPLQLGDQSDATHKTTDYIRQIYVQHWQFLWELYRTQGASAALEQVYQWINSALTTVYSTPIRTMSVMLSPQTDDDNNTMAPGPSGCCVSDIPPSSSSSSLSAKPDVDDDNTLCASNNVSYTVIKHAGYHGKARSPAFHLCADGDVKEDHDDDENELYNPDNDIDEEDDLYYPNPTERRRCHPKRRRRHAHDKTEMDDEISILPSIPVELPSIHAAGSCEVIPTPPLKKTKVLKKKRKRYGDNAMSHQNDRQHSGYGTPVADTNTVVTDGVTSPPLHGQGQDDSMGSVKRIKLEDATMTTTTDAVPVDNALSIQARPGCVNSLGQYSTAINSDHSSDDSSVSLSSSLSVLDALLLSNDWSSCEDDLLFGVLEDMHLLHPPPCHDSFMVDHVPDGAFLPLPHSHYKNDRHEVGMTKWPICTDSMFEDDYSQVTNTSDKSSYGSNLWLDTNSNGICNSYPSTLSQEDGEHSTERFLN